jgi:Holliday junction resolvase RusA-like endonuclease|tara:strand:+ start:30 stop:419 length:390 start_codon:yes stop_codon:yes gene_type:complete
MEWVFPISPVAASRPRVSRHGAYFAGPYKKFREECWDLVPMVLGPDFSPFDKGLYVDVELYVTRPKTTKLDTPRPDIDNYQKAVFDALNGFLWTDDKLIEAVYAVKQWAAKDMPGYFVVGVNYADEYDL